MDLEEWQDLHNASRLMPIETARNILKKIKLITPTTPHRLSKHLKGEGHLLCSDIHHYIVNQQLIHEHTAICLSECYTVEL